jgi:hypothetical protein
MEAKIENAIELLAGKIDRAASGDEAMKYAQALLNLANARCAVVSTK